MQPSFFNNVGVACGAVVNVSSATGMVDSRAMGLDVLLNHLVLQMHLALLH